MSQRQRYFLGVLCVCVALMFPACQQQPAGYTPPKLNAVVPIALGIDSSNGACTQNGVEGGNALIASSGVSWSAPSSTSALQFQLSSNCGVATGCSFSGTGSVSSGSSSAPSGTVMTYSNPVTIGTSTCNPGSMGLIMRP